MKEMKYDLLSLSQGLLLMVRLIFFLIFDDNIVIKMSHALKFGYFTVVQLDKLSIAIHEKTQPRVVFILNILPW